MDIEARLYHSMNQACVMVRYGMLDCANNYASKYGGKMCKLCNAIDDENHRMNLCKKWETINYYTSQTKVDFNDVYSSDENTCLRILGIIASLRDLENGKNGMRVQNS